MSNTDEGKPAGKSGQRSRKGDAAAKRRFPRRARQRARRRFNCKARIRINHCSRSRFTPRARRWTSRPSSTSRLLPSPRRPSRRPRSLRPSPEPNPNLANRASNLQRQNRRSRTCTGRVCTGRTCNGRTCAPAAPAPVTLQTITNAYRDYTRKSFEDFGSFFEQLSGARSLDKAMSVHTEFVKRAYETSVAESQKICELHSKLARQTLEPLQGLVGKARETRGKS